MNVIGKLKSVALLQLCTRMVWDYNAGDVLICTVAVDLGINIPTKVVEVIPGPGIDGEIFTSELKANIEMDAIRKSKARGH